MDTKYDKIALITGANSGIGFEIAKQLLNLNDEHVSDESHKHTILVLLGVRSSSKGAEASLALNGLGSAYSHHSIVQIDVTDDNTIVAARDLIEDRYGRLDILVNNAGHILDNEPLPQKDALSEVARIRDLYRKTYDVNVFGVAAVTEAFLRLLSKSESPRVVMTSSETGSLGRRAGPFSSEWDARFQKPGVPIYRSSKAALNFLTTHYAALGEQLGGMKWKVNATAPGLVATNFGGGAVRKIPQAGTAESGARNAVRLCLLDDDGETCSYTKMEDGKVTVVPW